MASEDKTFVALLIAMVLLFGIAAISESFDRAQQHTVHCEGADDDGE